VSPLQTQPAATVYRWQRYCIVFRISDMHSDLICPALVLFAIYLPLAQAIPHSHQSSLFHLPISSKSGAIPSPLFSMLSTGKTTPHDRVRGHVHMVFAQGISTSPWIPALAMSRTPNSRANRNICSEFLQRRTARSCTLVLTAPLQHSVRTRPRQGRMQAKAGTSPLPTVNIENRCCSRGIFR
jgi:hypothetical protein